MSRLGPIAVLVAAAALSACSTVQRVGGLFDGDDGPTQTAPQDGRISILTFEQQLTPDASLAGRSIIPPQAVSTTEWSQPGGTADNSPPHIAGTTNLDVAWRANLGQGSDRRVRLAAPPVIADGNLYFLDADHRVHAINALTGDRVWSRELRPSAGEDRRARGGGVAAMGGRVFVTTGFGFTVALNGATGDESWRTQASAPFHGAPTAAGGRVYAVTNDSEL